MGNLTALKNWYNLYLNSIITKQFFNQISFFFYSTEMVGDQPNILTTGVFERKELERYARGRISFQLLVVIETQLNK